MQHLESVNSIQSSQRPQWHKRHFVDCQSYLGTVSHFGNKEKKKNNCFFGNANTQLKFKLSQQYKRKNDLRCLGRRHCLCWGNCAHSKRPRAKKRDIKFTKKKSMKSFPPPLQILSKRQTTLWSMRTSQRSFLQRAQNIGKCFVCTKLTKVNLKILRPISRVSQFHCAHPCFEGLCVVTYLKSSFDQDSKSLTNSLRQRNSFMDSISEGVSQQLAWRAQRERWPHERITLFAAFCVLCFLLTLVAWQFP